MRFLRFQIRFLRPVPVLFSVALSGCILLLLLLFFYFFSRNFEVKFGSSRNFVTNCVSENISGPFDRDPDRNYVTESNQVGSL